MKLLIILRGKKIQKIVFLFLCYFPNWYIYSKFWGPTLACSSSLGDRFFAPLSFRAGNEKIIRSWHDVGCGNYLSKELYPELYLIATDRYSILMNHGFPQQVIKELFDYFSFVINEFFNYLLREPMIHQGFSLLGIRLGESNDGFALLQVDFRRK